MKEIFDSNEHVVAYTDGAAIGNPGDCGAGVAFFSQKFTEVIDQVEAED